MAKKKLDLDKKVNSVFDRMAGESAKQQEKQETPQEQVVKNSEIILPSIDQPTFKKHNAGNIKPYELSADGRKRFTTMMSPNLKSRLQAYGNKHGLSVADIIDIAAKVFLENKK